MQYELEHPFEYAYKGDLQTASFIDLEGPSYKTMAHFVPIKQAFTAAVSELTKTIDRSNVSEAKADDAGIDAEQVLQVMYQWSGEMSAVFLHAEQLFKSGVAMVDGETKLTTDLLGKMHFSDVENMLGAYIANFIAASLMAGG